MKQFASAFICLLVVASLISCAGTRTRESTGEYIDDTAITTKVKAALLADPEVSGLAISVETFKGVVQLSGFVDSKAHGQRAVEIARSIKGVKGVKNNTSLK
ncbi:MAG: BON domain-containing protein [Deltaproteobacteria bacterium]